MRVAFVVVLLTGCSRAVPSPAPIGNHAPRSGPGIPSIDPLTFHKLVADGGWDRLIDPAVGVIEWSVVSSAVDGTSDQYWVKRRCGRQATERVDSVAAAMRTRLAQYPTAYALACEAIGTYYACGQPGIGEYDLAYSLRFEQRAGGYVLVSLITHDVGTVAGAASETEDEYAAELAKSAGC